MPSRQPLRLAAAFALAALAGCSRDTYDTNLSYAVRTDLLVNTADSWVQQPTQFNRPGTLPLDALKTTPEREWTADQVNLQKEVGKKVLDLAVIKAEDRAQYAKVLAEFFGTPAAPKIGGLNAEVLKLGGNESLTPD